MPPRPHSQTAIPPPLPHTHRATKTAAVGGPRATAAHNNGQPTQRNGDPHALRTAGQGQSKEKRLRELLRSCRAVRDVFRSAEANTLTRAMLTNGRLC